MRYWIPSEVAPPLDADGFFRGPLPPGVTRGGPPDPDAKSLGDLDDVPCLILLGEGGIGKSTELEAAYERAADAGEPSLLVRLGSLTEGRVDRALLQNRQVVEWRERGGALTLFLDALDEAPAHVPVAALLRDDLLGGIPDALRPDRAEGLCLRITCRPSVWPRLLDRAFEAFWGEGGVRVWTLAPLTRDDVAEAAESKGLDPTAFLQDVRAVGGGPWAALPLSLRWLLDAARDSELPATRRELYERACRRLCEEQNEGRQAVGDVGALAPDHRLVVATRLAVLMRFGGRTAVWTGSPDAAPPGDLPARAAVGLDRAPGGGDLPVGERDVAEVVGHTGLFRSAGPDRFRWVHESIPDFLAAWSLAHRAVDPDLAITLLSDPSDRRVVPQLRDTAAWAASLDPAVADRLAERDPVVAASGDPQALPDDARESLVERLLTAYGTRHLDAYYERVPRPHALDHPRLADQLRRWLRDRDATSDARYEAIGIANRCGISDLVGDLFAVALDNDDDVWIRATAVRALGQLAPPDDLADLRPLALEAAPGDAEGTLTSAVRDVLWPAHLPFADLVVSLDADPYERTTEGDRVLSRFHLLPSEPLSTGQVVDGLRWAASGPPPRHNDLVESLARAGLQRAEDPSVAEALADLLVVEIGEEHGGRLSTPSVLTSSLQRPARALLQEVISRSASSSEENALFRVVNTLGLVSLADVPWLVRWLAPIDSAVRAQAVRLVAALFRVNNAPPDALQAAFDAVSAADLHDLSQAVDEATQPWATDGERADRLRDAFAPHPMPPLVEPPVEELIGGLLPNALEGDRTSWYNIRFVLQTLPTPERVREQGKWKTRPVGRDHDLTQLDGWEKCPPDLRKSIAQAAEAYLCHNAPDESDWEVFEGSEEETYRVLDAPRAFVLLDRVAPERLDALPEAVWAAWLPALLLTPASGNERLDRLLRRAVDARPEVAADLARRALPVVARHPGRMALDLALPLLDLDRPDLTEMVLDFAQSEDVPVREQRPLWNALANRGVGAALDRLRQSALDPDPERAATAVGDLLDAGDASAWPTVADRFATDDAFARALIAAVARSRNRQGRHALVSLPAVALLAFERRYRALAPPETDEPTSGFVDDEAMVHWIRRDVRDVLMARGTREAEDALLVLHAEFGDEDYARRAREAARRRREADFTPLPPRDVLRLLGTADQRLVRSADELFETVCHALAGFERWLRNDPPPRVFDLWNALPLSDALIAVAAHTPNAETVERLAALRGGSNPTVHVPKDENHLADLVQRYLRGRLSARHVVSHREVEVLKGHRPDLVVTTVPEGGWGPVSVAVEVKASWHPKVLSALEDQLVDGYLRRSDCAHGVYFVGWYGTSRWVAGPPTWAYAKRQQSGQFELNDLVSRLSAQAEQCSGPTARLASFVIDATLPSSRAS